MLTMMVKFGQLFIPSSGHTGRRGTRGIDVPRIGAALFFDDKFVLTRIHLVQEEDECVYKTRFTAISQWSIVFSN